MPKICPTGRPGLFGGLRSAVTVVAAATLLATSLPSSADVRSTTTIRYYGGGGSTAASLAAYVRSGPVAGDHGPAAANVHPSYSLAVVTSSGKGGCRASRVTLNLHFTMTLPRRGGTSSISPGTRAACLRVLCPGP